MRQILDLHIHSRYSRACSPKLTLENIAEAAKRKGVDIIATGDFTFPAWFKALKDGLEEVESSGLYRLKGKESVLFILSTEVSLVYRDGGKSRRIHLVLHAPDLAAVAELNRRLGARFNIRSDGRPILGISAPEFVRLCLDIDPRFLIYPAHIWTPWYSVFGSKSGFNSFEECFREQTGNIYAYETGLSSDPPLNWRLSSLDHLTRLSNSDAHSLDSIAREANIMSLAKTNYASIYKVIKENRVAGYAGNEGQLATIEFFPEEGMYHHDGHRDCGFSCTPLQSNHLGGLCPKCGRPLVIGVANRVEELADRPDGSRPPLAVPFHSIVGLEKIIAEAIGIKEAKALSVKRIYDKMITEIGNELFILIEAEIGKIGSIHAETAKAIRRMREGRVDLIAGFDGQYGQVSLLTKKAAKTTV